MKVVTGTEFRELVEPCNGKSWRATYHPERDFLNNYEFNVIVGADGKKDVLPGFPQIEMRGMSSCLHGFKLELLIKTLLYNSVDFTWF